jgi:hypothetical protein
MLFLLLVVFSIYISFIIKALIHYFHERSNSSSLSCCDYGEEDLVELMQYHVNELKNCYEKHLQSSQINPTKTDDKEAVNDIMTLIEALQEKLGNLDNSGVQSGEESGEKSDEGFNEESDEVSDDDLNEDSDKVSNEDSSTETDPSVATEITNTNTENTVSVSSI